MGRYKELTEKTSIEYVKENTKMFKPQDELTSAEIGDGNINWVFRISNTDNSHSVIFKQALPFVRVVGDSWPLTLDRSRIESETTTIFGSLCPENVPRVLHSEEDMAVTIFEDLGHLNLMRFELMNMQKFPHFPKQMGKFLAKTFLHTSHFVLEAERKKENVKKFANPELCKIVEDLVFTDPFFDAPGNNINPEVRTEAELLWNQTDVILEATRMKEIYMNKAQSLIHGDLHTGSIFINEDEVRVFDAEFAFYGPPSYDMGCVLGNLLLNYSYWNAFPDYDKKMVEDYRHYILDTFTSLYNHFQESFIELWNKDVKEEYSNVQGLADQCVKEHLEESIGFAGCECIRRSLGLAQVPDFTTIGDLKERSYAQRLSLKIGKALLRAWNDVDSIDQIKTLIENITLRDEDDAGNS